MLLMVCVNIIESLCFASKELAIDTLHELNIKKPFVVNKKMQLGDVYSTYASVNKLKKNYKYKPNTNINIGIKKFIQWYKKYNNII